MITKRYRELLAKQKEEVLLTNERLFHSMEVILDNVDKLYEQKRTEGVFSEESKSKKQNDVHGKNRKQVEIDN